MRPDVATLAGIPASTTAGGCRRFRTRYVFAKERIRLLDGANAKAAVPPFADSVLPVVEANMAEIVHNDYQIGDHVRLLPTPGPTPGHVAFTFGRGRDDAVMAGDLVHSPLQARYPELSHEIRH